MKIIFLKNLFQNTNFQIKICYKKLHKNNCEHTPKTLVVLSKGAAGIVLIL
jgi:hypothetical protein